MVQNKSFINIKDFKINSIVMAAPLAGVTDLVFRSIIREYNIDSLIVTEMISSEALQQRKPQRIIQKNENDSPIAYQLSGHKPELMLKSAIQLLDRADIIDINMGCPTPKIVRIGDGSGLMKTPDVAASIVKTLSQNIDKPVTVKMRLGWDFKSINAVEFAALMEQSGASMITVHGRTRTQMYSGRADWDCIAKAKRAVSIPVIANGDITSPENALKCLEITGCDGVALGRGLLGDPWMLNRIDHFFKTGELLPEPTIYERLDMAIYHCKKLVDFLGPHHGVRHSRKFFGWYIKYVKDAAKYRHILTHLETLDDIETVIKDIKIAVREDETLIIHHLTDS